MKKILNCRWKMVSYMVQDGPIADWTPYKIEVVPSGDHSPTEFFMMRCEDLVEDEFLILFDNDEPVGYCDGIEYTFVGYDVRMFYFGGE